MCVVGSKFTRSVENQPPHDAGYEDLLENKIFVAKMEKFCKVLDEVRVEIEFKINNN